jgi:succinylglutamate desuccinylase
MRTDLSLRFATSMNNIVFVAGLHGNEYLPVLALTSIGQKFVVGNPRALARGTRLYQSDLNASFGVKENNYEAKRAKEILALIPKGSRVVDFHTSIAAKKPFAILVDPKMLPLALRTGMRRIVYMKYNVKNGHALINHRHGVSVEVGQDMDRSSFEQTMKVVENVKSGVRTKNVELYEVFGKITKRGKYDNFKQHKDGFIPVLAGESSYRLYGLKARRVKSFS